MAPFFWCSALFLGLLQICNANPLNLKRWDDFETKHSWIDTPRGWELVGPVPADYSFQMRVGLKQHRIDELINYLYEVSDPTHSSYGVHLSKAEADLLAAPHPDSVDLVESWLIHHGIDPSSEISYSDAGDWLSMTVTIDQAERMLGTKYNVYKHTSTSETIVRTLSYSVPRIIYEHISLITPTTYFGTMKAMRTTSFFQEEVSGSDVPANCSTQITPECLRTLYNTIDYVPKATSSNKLGITGYLDEFANHVDLQIFFTQFRSDAVGADFDVIQVNGGGNNQSKYGIEANLDTQYAEGLSYPTPNIYYSTGGTPPFQPDEHTPNNTNEPYLDWLNFILAQSSIPQTFSTSYGDEEITVPHDYATSVCNLFAQLGVRGSSVIFSSGDSGVGADDCKMNDGTNATKFIPTFPASCPYVTSVGGTTGINPELAVDFSGGGFSNYFSRPAYQEKAVSTFLAELGNTYSGLYNASGRGIPDVSAQGHAYQVVIAGGTYSISGTSASAPTFASIVSLLNDYRIANGKPSLGFLNPMLYSVGVHGLNDVVGGNAPGCGTDGFTAVGGWDPVTGLGTPDFVKLQPIVLNLC